MKRACNMAQGVAFASLVLALSACAEPWEEDMAGYHPPTSTEPLMYCYKGLGQPTCYHEPLPRDRAQLIWAYNPDGSMPEPD